MSKECSYVKKANVKIRKIIMTEIIPKVREDIKKIYGKGFFDQIVGSAKRNLIVKKGKSPWDIDYQFLFNDELFNHVVPHNLKLDVKESIAKHIGECYSVKMSSSVIRISYLEQKSECSLEFHGFDVAILKPNLDTGNKDILRGKSNDKSPPHYVRWEEVSSSKSYDNRGKIKGSEMWNKMREIFLDKKCKNFLLPEDEKKPTFALYSESIEETLDFFSK